MTLDPPTLLLLNILIIGLVTVAYGVVWLENRKEPALLWMLGSAVSAGFGMVLRFMIPDTGAIVLSNGLIEGCGLCIWMACRSLRGRRTLPLLLLLPMAGWALGSLLPGFSEALSARIVVANMVMGVLFTLASREIWQLPAVSPLLRLSIFGLLAAQAGVSFAWALYNLLRPAPSGALLLTMRGIVLFDLATIIFTLLLAIGLIVMIRERAMAEYRREAVLDAVTGIGNRRAFDETVTKVLDRARRRSVPVSLVMVDVDNFKAFNDRYGHVEGDRCLRLIAQALAAALPSRGEAFRYGGEEFVVLLPGMSLTDALAVTEGLRLAVRRLAIAHAAREGGIVTVSQGVAARVPERDATEAARKLLIAADAALYRAKREGRDRVVAEGAAAPDPALGRIAS
ncbi:GGDEF domain-containing protein [Acidisoma sp. 7E03]